MPIASRSSSVPLALRCSAPPIHQGALRNKSLPKAKCDMCMVHSSAGPEAKAD